MEKYLHMMGKPARRDVIAYMVLKYGQSETANLLGVSKAAISKYMKGKTHPSDEILYKAFSINDSSLRKKMLERLAGELVDALDELVRDYGSIASQDELSLLRNTVCKTLCTIPRQVDRDNKKTSEAGQ